ncbi:MAG: tetratricopeptide repeat protein, partial [Phenylobacterium sp.]
MSPTSSPGGGEEPLAGARRLERSGDLTGALFAYEAALEARPDDPDILTGLGRLALGMGMAAVAEKMLTRSLELRKVDPESTSLLAAAFAAQDLPEKAFAVLRDSLMADPTDPGIWNQMGLAAADLGDLAAAEASFREALRLQPALTPPRFNLANLWLTSGDASLALQEFLQIPEVGLPARERATLVFSRACARLRCGDLREGWKDYAARNDPAFPGSADFDFPCPRWSPDLPLEGLRLLLVGEQGLGDEVMFAGVIPELMQRLGPAGRLRIAVEPRLLALFQRSFPMAEVMPHATTETGGRRVRRLDSSASGAQDCDAWAPMADMLQILRPRVADFRAGDAYLKPDPARVAEWRGILDGVAPGRRVGVLWKSG